MFHVEQFYFIFARNNQTMKKLLLLTIIILGAIKAPAQIEAVITTTITKGYGNFHINGKKFPLNSVIMNIDTKDTALVEFILLNHNAQYPNDIVSKAKKRVNYINGTTGLPFTSMTALKAYVDTFLYSH